jgi:hypothetical protein
MMIESHGKMKPVVVIAPGMDATIFEKATVW